MVSVSTIRYSHTVGCYALGGPGFLNPVGLTIGPDGTVYVLSRGHLETTENLRLKRVTLCNVEGDYLGEFSTGGAGDGELMWPSSITMDSDERIYVSDEALQRVSIFDKKGQFLSRWGTQGRGSGEFDRPAGLVVDRDDNILLVDGLNHRVQRYTKDGKFLGGWGSRGAGDGEFNFPWGINVDDAGNVYVADWRNDRIQKFDADGKHLATFGSSGSGDGQFNRPTGLAIDHDGWMYVADKSNERLQVLDADGKFVAKFRGQAEFSKWAQQWFDVSNEDLKAEWDAANLAPELDPSPNDFLSYESGSNISLFWGPSAVQIDAKGNTMVLETARHRIQVYVKG